MRQETILVVEDDADIHAFLRDTVLGPSGYRVLTALNGEEGLEIALAERPDLILLDLMMPRLPGLEFLRELQKKGVSIPTIVLTAYGSEQEILTAFHLGAKDFLLKPFEIEQLWGRSACDASARI
jgi:two-component system alkaline phosphatase synthesis response regulator PhoP